MIRILSIDGGGIKGLIPALVLEHLEGIAGRPTAELFDLIAGTSTGGILALLLTIPGRDGRPKYSAADAVKLYLREGKNIFKKKRFAWIRSLFEERYRSDGIEEVLRRYCGNHRLSDCVTEVLVPAWDLPHNQLKVFKRHEARAEYSLNPLIWTVARATSAAPTYFEPWRSLADGGMVANNPADCAWAEAIGLGHAPSHIYELSLGTGSSVERIDPHRAKRWGVRGWVRPVWQIYSEGPETKANYLSRRILGERFVRIQGELLGSKMDDISPKNIALLTEAAEKLIADHGQGLREVSEWQ